jgi:hypothetical protein
MKSKTNNGKKKAASKHKKLRLPQVGESVYIPPSNDCFGGLAVIDIITERMSGGEMKPFVGFKGITEDLHNWELLLEKQKRLKKLYKDQKARPDPEPE